MNGIQKAVMAAKLIVALLVTLSVAVVAYLFGRHIPYEQQLSIISGLSDTSAILFGVFGTWLAILYNPDIANRLTGKKGREALDIAEVIQTDAQRFRIIFNGIVASSCMILIILFASIAAPVVKALPWCVGQAMIIRGISFACLSVAVLFQFYVILAALAPMVEARRVVAAAKKDSDFVIENTKLR